MGRISVANLGGLRADLVSSGMISGLLYERRRRQANRFATAGELTASIAREINQPLRAIQTNVEVRDIDLNEVVRETEKFLSASSAFSVDLSTSISPERLSIRVIPEFVRWEP